MVYSYVHNFPKEFGVEWVPFSVLFFLGIQAFVGEAVEKRGEGAFGPSAVRGYPTARKSCLVSVRTYNIFFKQSDGTLISREVLVARFVAGESVEFFDPALSERVNVFFFFPLFRVFLGVG